MSKLVKVTAKTFKEKFTSIKTTCKALTFLKTKNHTEINFKNRYTKKVDALMKTTTNGATWNFFLSPNLL